MAMPYDLWVAIAFIGCAISLFGIYRLLADKIRADASDAFTFILGFIVMVVVALNASQVQYIACMSTGSCFTYNYTGLAIFTLPLFAFAALDMAMFFVSILKAVDIKKAKEQFIELQ